MALPRPHPGRTRDLASSILDRGTAANLSLRRGLAAVAIGICLASAKMIVEKYPLAVDIEIPLRAAERWLAGGEPYLASSFTANPGYDLPYLYPPYLLPPFAVLSLLPRALVDGGWLLACAGAAVATCRRLGLSWTVSILALLWPPFLEGIAGGNVQVFVFAAFVWLFATPRGGRIHTIDPARDERPAPLRVGLAVVTVVAKVTQVGPLILIARRRTRSAVATLVVLGALAVATLPLTGVPLWFSWLEQMREAANPAWGIGGHGLVHYLPTPVASALALLALAAVLVVPMATAIEWVGVLGVIGALSLHTFGMLFLLPAMLRIRRELALVAATLIATYSEAGWWIGIAIVTLALLIGEARDGLREGSPEGGRQAELHDPAGVRAGP